jgi:hypothetical protein
MDIARRVSSSGGLDPVARPFRRASGGPDRASDRAFDFIGGPRAVWIDVRPVEDRGVFGHYSGSFTHYSRDESFAVVGRNKAFPLVMAAGSIVGTFVGRQLLGLVPSGVLLPLLAVILPVSAYKVWQHK